MTPKHVAIVGGGIAGMTAAFCVQQRAAAAGLPVTCTLIEAQREWGGKIATHRVDDFIIEAGPDSFLSQKPWALDLCAELGLTDQLINTNETQEKAFVFSRGRLRPLPEGLVVVVPTKLGPFLRSGLISWRGLLRMACDLVIPPKWSNSQDESVASFFRRRLGREAFERLVEPLMAGIYAGDAEQISLRATFPRFREMERQYGSLIGGMLAARRAATSARREGMGGWSTFVTLRGGLRTMTDALVARIQAAGGRLMAGCRARTLTGRPNGAGGWIYELGLDGGPVVPADAVVLATPAYVTAELVRALGSRAAALLEAIPYASTATVALAYDTNDLGPQVRGFGFVVPRVEGRSLLAATWTSLKWPNRAPPSKMLVRCYVGGVGREDILKADDETLVRQVALELKEIAGIAREPSYAEVNRWIRGIPQYTLGHLERLEEIQMLLRPYRGLYLTGAAYRGVGIPDCIRDAAEAADQVIRDLIAGSS